MGLHYNSIRDLRLDYINIGGDCNGYREEHRFRTAAEGVACDDSARLLTFVSADDRDAAMDRLKALHKPPFVVGENWLVVGGVDAQRVADGLGGVVVSS